MSRSTSLLDDREENYKYRGYNSEDTHRPDSFGPSGEGIGGAASTFYSKNRKAILITAGVTVLVLLLIIIIAVVASGKGDGNDPYVPPGPPYSHHYHPRRHDGLHDRQGRAYAVLPTRHHGRQ